MNSPWPRRNLNIFDTRRPCAYKPDSPHPRTPRFLFVPTYSVVPNSPPFPLKSPPSHLKPPTDASWIAHHRRPTPQKCATSSCQAKRHSSWMSPRPLLGSPCFRRTALLFFGLFDHFRTFPYPHFRLRSTAR